MDKETERKLEKKRMEEANKRFIETSKKAKEAGLSYGKYVALMSMEKHSFSKSV